MVSQCRTGDIGIGVCYGHTSPVVYVTVFIQTSPVTSDAFGEAVVTTVGVSSCTHPTVALTGSEYTKNEGLGTHRVGDMGLNVGPYTAIIGSPYNKVG